MSDEKSASRAADAARPRLGRTLARLMGAPAPAEAGTAADGEMLAASREESEILAQGQPGEYGGPKGPEPTRYGDWERKGRCIDF